MFQNEFSTSQPRHQVSNYKPHGQCHRGRGRGESVHVTGFRQFGKGPHYSAYIPVFLGSIKGHQAVISLDGTCGQRPS